MKRTVKLLYFLKYSKQLFSYKFCIKQTSDYIDITNNKQSKTYPMTGTNSHFQSEEIEYRHRQEDLLIVLTNQTRPKTISK